MHGLREFTLEEYWMIKSGDHPFFQVVSEEITDINRWDSTERVIIEDVVDGGFYEFFAECPLTEYQDWDWGRNSMWRVWPHTVQTVEYYQSEEVVH